MKTKLATAIFSLATALVSAQELPVNQTSVIYPLELTVVEKVPVASSYGYVRMGISDNDAIHTLETLPGVGVGYRYAVHSAAIDFSANYTRQFGDSNFFFTAPKVSYLRYVSPVQQQSIYYGAGLAWGGLKRGLLNSFQGLIANATLGYEMNRHADWVSFFQLDVSQPAVAVSNWNVYSVTGLPSPLAEVSVGLGY